ncbi:MAG TPA: homoserine O-succinyltransferase [Arenimonas sp.]|nr:homoserine O-succinyltransferase [Arenimonas sp.]
MSLAPAAHVEANASGDTFVASHDPVASSSVVDVVIRELRLACELDLRHAGRRTVQVRARLEGRVGSPLLVVAGGISADRRVCADPALPRSGWWVAQAGRGKALDTQRFRLLAIDWLGSDGSLDVAIDPADQADAIAAVLDRLGERRVAAFVGASYGAMVGLQFAARHGHRLQQLVAISGAHRPHPYATAWRALQRQVARLGRGEAGAATALALARQWAMLSYRTPEEFAERFAAAPELREGELVCASEAYLAHCGARYAARWSSTTFLRLSESIDLQQVEPESIRVPTTVVAVAEDRLVPVDDAFELCERLGAYGSLRLLRSRFGHDAFLKEEERVDALLRALLADAHGAAA